MLLRMYVVTDEVRTQESTPKNYFLFFTVHLFGLVSVFPWEFGCVKNIG